MSLAVFLLILLGLQTILLLERCWEVKTLKRLHRHDLETTRKQWLEFGITEGRMSLPMIQHCNRRINYRLIQHRWDPDRCDECKIIRDLLEE